MAETEGFEPSDPVRGLHLSRVKSATRVPVGSIGRLPRNPADLGIHLAISRLLRVTLHALNAHLKRLAPPSSGSSGTPGGPLVGRDNGSPLRSSRGCRSVSVWRGACGGDVVLHVDVEIHRARNVEGDHLDAVGAKALGGGGTRSAGCAGMRLASWVLAKTDSSTLCEVISRSPSLTSRR